MIKIPVYQNVSADFSQTIELDGILVDLRIVYNIRSGHFFLSAKTEKSQVDGVKIVAGYPLLRYKRLLEDLPGDFIVLKTDESKTEPIGYDELGAGWDLYYITAEEYDQWEDLHGLE